MLKNPILQSKCISRHHLFVKMIFNFVIHIKNVTLNFKPIVLVDRDKKHHGLSILNVFFYVCFCLFSFMFRVLFLFLIYLLYCCVYLFFFCLVCFNQLHDILFKLSFFSKSHRFAIHDMHMSEKISITILLVVCGINAISCFPFWFDYLFHLNLDITVCNPIIYLYRHIFLLDYNISLCVIQSFWKNRGCRSGQQLDKH